MKIMTVKAAIALTRKCGIHPVISHEDRAQRDKGMGKWDKKQKYTTVHYFYDPESQFTASKDAM